MPRQVTDLEERQTILALLKQRQDADPDGHYVYFCAPVRVGDMNITMRLRDGRPQGEAIAPLQLRQLMHQEARAELAHYQD